MASTIASYVYHSSKRIFVNDMDKSLDFYNRIGFVRRYLVLDFAHYLSLGNINLELWHNQNNITVPKMHDDNGRDYVDPILFINIKDKSSLQIVHDEIKSNGIKVDAKEIDNDSSPYGENFTVDDPDGYRTVFRTLKNVGNIQT